MPLAPTTAISLFATANFSSCLLCSNGSALRHGSEPRQGRSRSPVSHSTLAIGEQATEATLLRWLNPDLHVLTHLVHRGVEVFDLITISLIFRYVRPTGFGQPVTHLFRVEVLTVDWSARLLAP